MNQKDLPEKFIRVRPKAAIAAKNTASPDPTSP